MDSQNEIEKLFKIYNSSSSLYGRKNKIKIYKYNYNEDSSLYKRKPQYENFYFYRTEFNEDLQKEFKSLLN
jgi:hypothetical protein